MNTVHQWQILMNLDPEVRSSGKVHISLPITLQLDMTSGSGFATAVHSSETVVSIYKTTWHHISKRQQSSIPLLITPIKIGC
jgi:hypothetical protein